MVCGLAKLKLNLAKAAADTATVNRSEPDVEIPASVAETIALSALNKIMLAVATPLVKVTFIAVPKFTPLTVGFVTGLAELVAPEKVMLLTPV
ncbi:hypothetical protein AQBE111736_13840 [Aquirufa beregesia]